MAQSDAVLLSVWRRDRRSGAEQAEAAEAGREGAGPAEKDDAAERLVAPAMQRLKQYSKAASIVAAGEAVLAAWQYKKAEPDRAAQKSMTAAMRKA